MKIFFAALVILFAFLPISSALATDGRLVYGITGNTSPQLRTWTGSSNTFSTVSGTIAANTTANWTVTQSAPVTRTENIVGTIASTGPTLYIQHYDNSAWTNEWNVTVPTATKQCFDIAYENVTGDALVVYSTGTNMAYRVWNGTSWTAAANVLSTAEANNIEWVELVAKPASDEISLLYAYNDGTTGYSLKGVTWSGTAWSAKSAVLEANLSYIGTTYGVTKSFDAVYQNSGNLMVVWGRGVGTGTVTAGTAAYYWQRTSGAAWPTSTPTVTGMGTWTYIPVTISLAAEPGTNYIVVAGAARSTTYGFYEYGIWNGSSWANVTGGATATRLNLASVAAGRMPVATGWNSTGALVVYAGRTANLVYSSFWTKSTASWAAGSSWTPTGTMGNIGSVKLQKDPGLNVLVALIADTNNNLWGKYYNGSWNNGDGGTALAAANIGTLTGTPFDFTYTRFSDTIAPTTTLSTNPTTPDGTNGWFKSATTITLTSSEPGTTYYQWDGTGGAWTTYAGLFPALAGNHTLYYYSKDLSNNSETYKSTAINVDVTAPTTPALSSPADAGYVNSTRPTLSWSASTDGGSGIAYYIVNVDGVQDQTTAATSVQTAATLTQASHTWQIIAVDNAGNQSTASTTQTFTVDTASPTTIFSTSPITPDGSNGWFKSATTITLTSSEPGTTYYQWDGTGGAWTTYSAPFAALAGNHTLYFYSTDSAGNAETYKSQAINVDATAPTIPSLTTPNDASFVNNTLPVLLWAVSTDGGSGIAYYNVNIDGSLNQTTSATSVAPKTALTQASHTWQIIAVDNAGNLSAASATRTFTVDTTNPTAAITSPANSSYPQGTINIVGTASDTNFNNYVLEYGAGAAPSSWTNITTSPTAVTNNTLGSLNTGSLGNGDYTIRLTVTDKASNSTQTTVLIHVDHIAPTTTLSTSPITPDGTNGWFKSATTITLTSSEPGTTYYQWDGTGGAWTTYTGALAAQQGNHTLYYYSVDTAANTEANKNLAIKVDTVAPTGLSLTTPADASFVNTQQPTLTWSGATDASSGLANYIVKIDGADNQTVGSAVVTTQTAGTLTQASHTWQIVAIDNAGNQATSTSRTFTVDVTNPTASITAPLDNTYVTGSITVTGTAADTNFNNYTLEYGAGSSPSSWTTINSATTTVTNNALGSLDTGLLPNGDYTIRLRVTDKANNSATPASILVHVDHAAPTTTLSTSPITPDGSNGWFKSATTITLTSSKPGSTYYQWDGTGGAWSTYSVPFAAFEGSHTLYFYSKDSLNNTEGNKSQVIKVDTAAPGAAILSTPADNGWASGVQPTLTWTVATDTSSGIANYVIKIDGATDQTVTGSTLSAATVAMLTETSHTWQIIAVDNAGNQTSSAIHTMKVDYSSPTATISAPANNATVVDTITITGTASDTNFANYKLEYGAGASPSSWTTITNPTTPVTNGTLGTFGTRTVANGQYTIRLTVTDNAAKSSTTSVLINVNNDIIAPTTTLSTSPITPDGTNGWFKSATTITLTSSEPGTTYYQWDGTGGAWTTYTGALAAQQGNHTLYYYSVDTAANTEANKNLAIKVDTAAPATFTLSSPADNSWTTNQKPTLIWTAATDTSSGIANYVIKIDGANDQTVSGATLSTVTATTLTEASHTWQIIAIDNAGNQTSSLTRTVKVDLANPIATISAPANNATVNGLVTITGTASDTNFANYKLEYGAGASPSSWTTITNPTTPVTNGTLGAWDTIGLNGDYTIRLTVNDNAVKSTTATILVHLDNGVPATTITTSPAAADGANGWFKSATTITLTSSKPGTTYYQWDSTGGAWTTYTIPFAAQQGNHTLYFYSKDALNNAETAKNQAVKVDTVAPGATTLSTPADNSWTMNQKPTLIWTAATDTSSGIANYVIKIDGANDQTVSGATLSTVTATSLADGSHTWQVVAVDNAGNQTASATRTIRVDRTSPTAMITAPANDAIVSGLITITGTASDTNFANYKLEYGAGASPSSWTTITNPTTPVTNGTLGTLDTNVLGSGDFTIRLTSTDSAANTATMSILIHIDTVPPTTTLSTSPITPDGTNGWFKSATTITLTSSEPGTTYYQWDGTGGAWTTYTGALAAQQGNHTLYYYSVDTAANTEANKNLAIKVDTAAPATFTLSSPADNSWTTNQKPTLGWNASSDVLSGLANYVVRIDGATDQTLTSSTLSATTVATLTEGMHAWQVVAVDNAGNQTAATARTISVDLANPTATITVPTNDATINGTINITGSATDPNFNNYVLDYGSGASPSSWTTIATSNTAVANGTLGTLNTSSIGNGQYTIRLRSYDKASKTATMSILVTVTNDVTPPVTTLSTNPGTADGANGWFKSATAITLTSSEPGSTYYQWDGTGGAWTTYTGPFAVLEGNHALHYYSKDTANNTEVTKNQAIKLDTVAPVAPGLSSPADSAWIINQRPTLGWNSVTDATSGLASYRIKVDASIDQTVGSSVTSTQTAATLTEGTHTWQIIAVDGAGNLGTSASRTINIDIANPTASITAPTDGASVSGTINITGSATDANFKNYALEYGAGATPLSWTPITNPTTPITSGTLGSLNTSTLANGLYTIRLTANDNASKTSTASIQINVTNDVTAPTTTLSTNPSAINGKNGWFNTATTITLSPSEPGTTYYKWDGAPTDTTYTGPFAALEGTHTLSYYSKDTVNNTETVRNQTIKVDTAAPALFNLTSPADASWQSTTSQTLRWGASSDATSNLVSYIVKVDGGINKTVAAGTTQAAVTLTEGSHNWQVIAEDNAGNQTASSTWSVSIDTANPVANIVAPANNATISGTVAINGTASDINIASYKLEYGVGASPSSWTTITSSTASVTSGTLGTLNTTLLADGAYTIRLTVTDKAAKTTVASIAVTANNDTVAPTTTVITSPAAPDGTNGWFKSATTLTLASSEPGSTYYQWDGTGGTWNAYTGPIAAPEGNHTLYYYSKDAINNMEATKNLAVKVDMSAPSTPAMPAEPFNDIWLSTQTPAFKWTPAADSMSGILKYKLMIDGVMNKEVGGAITATTPTALAAGSHTWNIVAVDAAGNEAASSSTWTIKIDLTNPVAVITAPANGALVSNTIAVTGSATDANFEKYVLEYGRGTSPTSWTTINEAINQVNNGTLGSIDTTNWQNGTYTIRLTANDITGRSATTSITVTSGNVDGNPPIWSGSTAVEAVPISYDQIYVRWPEATDTVGVAGYEIHKVYSGTDSIIETGTGTYYIAQGLLPNQEYTFYVKAYDDAGNRSVKTLDAVATTFKKQEYIVTPPSSDKTVEVPLSGIGTKVIFDNVTSGGEVNFVGYSSLPQLKAPLPPLPSDAQPIIGAIFDVALGETFIYEGNVQIIIPYTKLGISQPDKLELWHYNTKRQPAAWETLPKQVRVDQGVVVFTTTSFSPYVLVYSASAPGQVAYGMNTNMLLAMALLMMASGVFFIRGLARHPF